MIKVQDYKNRIEKFIFNGQELKHIEHSLYQVGSEYFVISATKPDGENYFFGLNENYIEKADYVILICGNDLCAFKIPVGFIKELGLNRDEKNGRYLPTVGFNDTKQDWYIVCKASENKDTKISISSYFISIKKDEEIIIDAMALKKFLS